MAIGFVIIGRNEGERLLRCLASLPKDYPVVYVDSGSTDDSCAAASEHGATVLTLDMSIPFTAARARNVGWHQLLIVAPAVQYIQFLDGDCELDANWVHSALEFLEKNSDYAVVCGRRREIQPEASIYNSLCDVEWDTPIGDAKACGGDAMIRTRALRNVNGYNDSLIAGEEPELCVRIRALGNKVKRLDLEMTRHDAAITQFNQWWRRNVRSGFAYANGAALHGAAPEYHWVKETKRACLWGGVIPLLILIGILAGPGWMLVLLGIYPLQWLRLIKNAPRKVIAKQWAGFMVLAKFAEFQGVIQYLYKRVLGQTATLIEYK